MKGTVTIGRTASNTREDFIRLEVNQAGPKSRVLLAELGLADFMLALTGEYGVEAELEFAEAVAAGAARHDFLAHGARFKLSPGEHGAEFLTFPAELAGRWVALVAAEDGRHLAAGPDERERALARINALTAVVRMQDPPPDQMRAALERIEVLAHLALYDLEALPSALDEAAAEVPGV